MMYYLGYLSSYMGSKGCIETVGRTYNLLETKSTCPIWAN